MKQKEVALMAVKKAGVILKQNFYAKILVERKEQNDIVTETDRNSEELILKTLKYHFPDYSYIAEESGTQKTNSEYCWYIDPLDGTTNFVTGNPYFSVSLALAYNNEIVLAYVYNPITDELFFAEKNKGSFLNGEKIKVSKNNQVGKAFAACSYSMEEHKIKDGLKTIESLSIMVQKVLANFSPALDLCNIARGKMHILVDNGTTPEDHAAGSLILTEAGGSVQNYNNKSWDVEEQGIIATNGIFQKTITDLVWNK